ncbi:MAG: nucleotidyltransferase domain-containing protein [Pseudomonadota bacterium]
MTLTAPNTEPLPEALQKLLARIVPALDPEALFLFGSRAERRARPDSDYDLLVIMPDDAPRERINMVAAYEATRGAGVAADVIPCRRSIFERKKYVPGTLSRSAWLRGTLVYER